MLKEYKTKTNIGIGGGLVLQFLGGSFMVESPGFGLSLVLGGVALFIYGSFSYAKGKGHSPMLGVVGLIGVLGLVILVLLPDKHKERKKEKHRKEKGLDEGENITKKTNVTKGKDI